VTVSTELGHLSVSEPTFSAKTVPFGAHSDGLRLQLSGTADLRVVWQLQQLLQQLHEKALALKVKEIDVAFMHLEFMNSSCFNSIVNWVSQIQDLPNEMQYHIKFHAEPDMQWQKRCLHALKCFADDLVIVE